MTAHPELILGSVGEFEQTGRPAWIQLGLRAIGDENKNRPWVRSHCQLDGKSSKRVQTGGATQNWCFEICNEGQPQFSAELAGITVLFGLTIRMDSDVRTREASWGLVRDRQAKLKP